MNTALYVQDSYAIGRLTLIARHPLGARRGLPAAAGPIATNQFFPAGMVINGLNVNLNTGGVADAVHRTRQLR